MKRIRKSCKRRQQIFKNWKNKHIQNEQNIKRKLNWKNEKEVRRIHLKVYQQFGVPSCDLHMARGKRNTKLIKETRRNITNAKTTITLFGLEGTWK